MALAGKKSILRPASGHFLAQEDAVQFHGLFQKIADWIDAFDKIERHNGFGGRVLRIRAQGDHPLVVLPADSHDGADLNDQFSITVITDGELAGQRQALQQSGINSRPITNNPHLYFHAPHSYRFRYLPDDPKTFLKKDADERR